VPGAGRDRAVDDRARAADRAADPALGAAVNDDRALPLVLGADGLAQQLQSGDTIGYVTIRGRTGASPAAISIQMASETTPANNCVVKTGSQMRYKAS
jgi:hypothetical protein